MAEYSTVNSKREKTTDLMLEKIYDQSAEILKLQKENAELKTTVEVYMRAVDALERV